MSAYVERWCRTHGTWDDDVDNPGECPECLHEGITYVQRLEREIAELKEQLKNTTRKCVRN